MQVKSVFTDDIEAIDGVCIAVGRPQKKLNQQHIGFYYRDKDSEPKFLHLAWHFELKKDTPSRKYLWLDVALDEINKIHLATVLELVYESNKQTGIPYGICIDGTGFAKDGKYTADQLQAGLTCATFVVQIFHSQQYFIIDLNRWRHRQADIKWQRQIIQKLKKYASKEHIEYQNKKIMSGASRFKPEEIAVAAHLPSPPHGFEEIKSPAGQLLNMVIAHAKALTVAS